MTDTSRPSLKGQAATAGRTFFISGFGTALEFYDFIIYGLAAAIVFPTLFFPSFDHMVGTLVAFAAFGVGFIARPLGGIVFGHFGDRIGRKSMLVLTLLLMGGSTFLIGCLPTYAAVGVLAPIALVVLRLVQGFAAGGEWGGASLFGIENSPENRRGLWGSFTSTGIGIGSLLGTRVHRDHPVPGRADHGLGLAGAVLAGWAAGAGRLAARLRMPQEQTPARTGCRCWMRSSPILARCCWPSGWRSATTPWPTSVRSSP